MEDRWTAIRWAIGTARENDCVVIAGKGHEDFQEIVTDGEMARVGPRKLSMTLPPAVTFPASRLRLQ